MDLLLICTTMLVCLFVSIVPLRKTVLSKIHWTFHRTRDLRCAQAVASREFPSQVQVATPSGTSGIYRLPQELLDKIVDALSDNRAALIACATTSRAFLCRARKYLLHKVVLQPGPNGEDAIRCYAFSPDTCRSVRDLNIHASAGMSLNWKTSPKKDWLGRKDVLHILRQLTEVRSLGLVRFSWESIPSPTRTLITAGFASVQRLSVIDALFEDIHELSAVIASFPQLRSLLIGLDWTAECTCANHGRHRADSTMGKVIHPPPPSLRLFCHEKHFGATRALDDIARWYSTLPPEQADLTKLDSWICSFTSQQYDHVAMLNTAGPSLRFLNFIWHLDAQKSSDPRVSLGFLSSNTNLESLHITFPDVGISTQLNSASGVPYCNPACDTKTEWLPQVIRSITSNSLKEVHLSFSYILEPHEVSFITTFLHLEELDEILSQPRFHSLHTVLFNINMTFRGDPEHDVDEFQKEMNEVLALSMPKAVEKRVLQSSISISGKEWG